MSLPNPTAPGTGRAKRLAAWWSGWPRLVALAIAGLAGLAVALGSVQGVRLLGRLEEHPTVDVPVEPREEGYFASHPRNVLILGSDTRSGLSEEDQVRFGGPEDVRGERSDTIILMHVDPRQERAVVVHFPRDLLVRIPGHGPDRINAAFELGGPDLVVRTVRRFTGLPIHTYVEVDLAGFQHLVDTLGGVRICVDRAMVDPLAGLNLPAPGCYDLDGQEALGFVRARHIEGDLIPDFSRIARQQQFMRAMLNRLLSVRSLLDADLIAEAAGNVTTDQHISGATFIYLGTELRELAAEDPSGASALDFRVVPSVPRGLSYVVATPEADELFRRLRRGRPLGRLGEVLVNTEISEAQIEVVVLDAGDRAAVSSVEDRLRQAGFIVLGSARAPARFDRSRILFAPGSEARADVVSGYFPGLPVTEGPPGVLQRAEVAVVVADGRVVAA
ncbi:MAG TPA: LCP family protein [Actinomycetota bacterium]|nr:LCP family protein [Actinomycetota bacterium]